MRKQTGGWMSLVRVLLIVSLVISLLPAISLTVSADTGVVYIDEHGVTQTQDVTIIDQDNYGSYATLNAGWYLFRGTWQSNTTIATSGAVHIILEDGSDVTVTGSSNEAGIKVTNGNSLTIYAQSTGEGMGKLVANGSSYSAGIGGSDGSSIGTITINGGDISATGRSGGAGIGRGYSGAGGTITINGGDITAIGGVDGAGIGRGPSGTGTGPNIFVNGSYGYWTSNTVSAPSSMTGSGIFNGDSSSIFKGYVRYVKLISIEFITSPAITVTDPVTGAAPNATASVTGAVYFTAGAVSWTPTATVFEGSTPYTATVTLTADSGYLFASTLTEATINGNAATVTNNTGETVTLSYSFAETATEITSPAITVTAPVTGATPNATASVVGAVYFTAGTVTWSPMVTTFAGSTSYTATVILTANSGYVFPSTLTAATINGNTATVTNNTGETVTLSYSFAETVASGGGTSTPSTPSTPSAPSASPQPEPEPEPEPPTQQPAVEVFNSNIVNSASLVEKLIAQVAAAKDAATTTHFGDTQEHWAEGTIVIFVQLNLINGYEDGTFRPNSPITRAEFASILNRVFQIQGGSTSKVLKDIDGTWAQSDIENLVAAGVISGYPDGTFKPNQTVTREEMVVILSRIVNLNGVDKDAAKGLFNDLAGAYAAEAITAAAQAGIVNGKGEGKFGPKSNATRAEALQIILNVLKLNPELKMLLESLE